MKNLIPFLLLGAFLFYMSSIGKNRERMIDYLNLRFGNKGFARLSDSELKSVYSVTRLLKMGVKPDTKDLAQIEPILLKYEIKLTE